MEKVLRSKSYIYIYIYIYRFSDEHDFQKPNDERALKLMTESAIAVMKELGDIKLCFGESDEYSFIFTKSMKLFNRRAQKIVTTVVSIFTANYIFKWNKYFKERALIYPPSFDGRGILYPTFSHIQDYLRWRQVDTHINNLYNTTFWSLVQEGERTRTEAHATLKGTLSSAKNEILFTQFGINYNNIQPIYTKGTILIALKSSTKGKSTGKTKRLMHLPADKRDLNLISTPEGNLEEIKQEIPEVDQGLEEIEEKELGSKFENLLVSNDKGKVYNIHELLE